MRSSSSSNIYYSGVTPPAINPWIIGAATVAHQPLAVFFQKFIIDANSGRRFSFLAPRMFLFSSLTRSAHRGSRNMLVSYILAHQIQSQAVEKQKVQSLSARLLLSLYEAGPAAAIGVSAAHYLELLQFRFAKEDAKTTPITKLLRIDPMTFLKTWRASIVPSTIRTAGLMGLGGELGKFYDEQLGKEKSQAKQVAERSFLQGAGITGLEVPFLFWAMYGITQNLNGNRIRPSAKHFMRVGAITLPCALAINGSFFAIFNTVTSYANPPRQDVSVSNKSLGLFAQNNPQDNKGNDNTPRAH